MKHFKTALLASAMTLTAGSANAVFVGDQVDFLLNAPNTVGAILSQTGTAVVDPGVEATGIFDIVGQVNDPTWTADLSAAQLTLTYEWIGISSQIGDQILWTVSDMDLQGGLVGGITGISLNSTQGPTSAAEIASTGFSSNSVSVELTNFTTQVNDAQRVWVFDITHDGVTPEPPDIPVPAALPLLAGGIGMLGLMARRRKK